MTRDPRGRNVCFGASMAPTGPLIMGLRDTAALVLVRQVNAVLREFAPAGAAWSSIQLNHNTVASLHEDKGNTGLSMIVIVGSFSGGSFLARK